MSIAVAAAALPCLQHDTLPPFSSLSVLFPFRSFPSLPFVPSFPPSLSSFFPFLLSSPLSPPLFTYLPSLVFFLTSNSHRPIPPPVPFPYTSSCFFPLHLLTLSSFPTPPYLGFLLHSSSPSFTSSFRFSSFLQNILCGYLEPPFVTRAQYAWAAENQCQYLFTKGNSTATSTSTACQIASLEAECDMPGNDLMTQVLPPNPSPAANANTCGQLCCSQPLCTGFVYAIAPTNYMTCTAGQPCCYLKSENAASINSTVEDIYCGTVTGQPPPPTPADSPPTGMRSAVPHGGLGAGSIELRADGTLHEWTIVNQSPAGAAKFHSFDNAFFGLHTADESGETFAATLRTTPPAGLPGVRSLRYNGAHPVSRLEPLDDRFLADASLFAYSSYHLNDLTASSKPGIYYTLLAENPSAQTVNVTFLLTMPLAIEEDTTRLDPNGKRVSASSPVNCLHACQADASCASWTWSTTGCTLSTVVPLNTYANGTFSGVKSQWAAKATPLSQCLTLARQGTGPTAGNLSLCLPLSTSTQQGVNQDTNDIGFSYGSADDAQSIWDLFSAHGTLNQNTSGAYGAVAVRVTLAPYASAVLPIMLTWYFPNRDHLGANIGNYYANLWPDSQAVADAMAASHTDALTNITALHTAFFNSSLPEWLQDALINTLSHPRSAWWTRDGRWRQWEAYDCVNIDSVHNDGERHLPYIFFFPETTRNKLQAWGKYALADGMINEQLGCGCMGPVPNLDDACGRVMSDVTSMFIMYVLELYKWSNDTETLEALWPHVLQGAQWQMSVSQEYGIPAHLVATYDILGLDQYPTATYNAIFHLMAMKAAQELALVMGNASFAETCNTAFLRGQRALDDLLWVEAGNASHYAAVQGVNASLMADCMYAQVLAYSSGLGLLMQDQERLATHLVNEGLSNDTPFGLRAITGAQIGGTDDCIWQGASPNWATLNLHLYGASAYPAALAQPEKSLNVWRERLNDQWNTAGLAGHDGYPYITSHYGFHMVQWHLPLAISGQQAHLPNGTLTFAPVISPPYTLPILLPGVLGSLSAIQSDPHTVTFDVKLTSGSLSLTYLAVAGHICPNSTIALSAGQSISWTSS
eukprot:m.96381 g.96381  ORF g.96381 m.96381 type:complete len:1092 (-) comp14791_c0_seq2:334-3609(-)